MRSGHLLLVIVCCCFSLYFVETAEAARKKLKVCVAGSGKLTVRRKCRKKETALDVEALENIVTVSVEEGAPGPQGPKGDPGARGAQGETGPQGPAGPAGLTGSKGDTGPQGSKGDTGPQGTKGDTGPQGAKGDTGPQGEQGPPGVAGAVAVGSTNGSTTSSQQILAGDSKSLGFSCPESHPTLVGGGCRVTTSNRVFFSIISSYPSASRRWECEWVNTDIVRRTASFEAWATCLKFKIF